MLRVGVLALQGDFEKHAIALRAAGVDVPEVRMPSQLDGLHGLVVPGGESTTLLKLMEGTSFVDDIRRFHRRGRAVFGTCAGLILLAKRARNPEQASLGLLDVDVLRNGYGRQVDSFEASVSVPCLGEPRLPMVFIRAPIIESVGAAVEVLATHGGRPVLVRSDGILAATFHPELTADLRVHRFFAAMCAPPPGRMTWSSRWRAPGFQEEDTAPVWISNRFQHAPYQRRHSSRLMPGCAKRSGVKSPG